MMIRKHKDACEPPEERGPFLWRQSDTAGKRIPGLEIAILWVPIQIGIKAGIAVGIG
ncbi:MAG: hypothetical protein ACYS3N_11285 [Planctomycetota bacterium]